MKTSLDHLPSRKQHELRRVVEIIHEEFDDALKAGRRSLQRGRILKMLLFGLHAGGRLVDESVGTEGYRSDFDILIVVNNKKLTDPALWNRARDRLMRDPEIKTPVSVIVHALREVNSDLKRGRSFFVDIARDGIALYELDDEPLAAPGQLSPELAWRIASEYFEDRVPLARKFLNGARFYRDEDDYKLAAFLLHQSIEQAYSSVLLVLTNYSPTSHNLRFLRGLAEERAQELTGVWREDQQRYVAWFNLIDEAYIKARYSPITRSPRKPWTGFFIGPKISSAGWRPSGLPISPAFARPSDMDSLRILPTHLAARLKASYLKSQPRHGAPRWIDWVDKRSPTINSKPYRPSPPAGARGTPSLASVVKSSARRRAWTQTVVGSVKSAWRPDTIGARVPRRWPRWRLLMLSEASFAAMIEDAGSAAGGSD